MLALFIDGPLAGEVKTIPQMPRYEVAMPARMTYCLCDPTEDYESPVTPPENVSYYPIMVGLDGATAILSSKQGATGQAVFDHLRSWSMTDLRVSLMRRNCQSERAWT